MKHQNNPFLASPDGPYNRMQADIKAPKPCTCGRVCFWLLWVLLFFTLILGAVALILYFVYQPQAPNFEIVHFQITNLKVVAGTSTTAVFFLDALANYTLAGYNPNKGAIYYDYINTTVYFNQFEFGHSDIPPFTTAPQSSSVINGSLIVDKFPLTLGIGGAFLSLYNTGTVPFMVKSVAGAHLNILGMASPSVQVTLTCNVTINIATAQTTSKACTSMNIHP